MKKFFVLLIASVLMTSFAGVSFAAKAKTPALKGTITAIDTAQNQVTIQDAKGTSTTVSADSTQIVSLKIGEKVKVKLKADGKTAEKFKEITKEKAAPKEAPKKTQKVK
jgi:hypothetical protein